MTHSVAMRDLHRVVSVCFIHRVMRIDEKVGRRFLILKRRTDLKVYPGRWTVPGGGLERKDYEAREMTGSDTWEHPVEQSLRREIFEEAGVIVGPLEFFGSFAFVRPDGIPVAGLRFAAPYSSGVVKIGPEDSVDYRWITADERGEYDLLGNIAVEMDKVDTWLARAAI
jgi:8-oxo-dGTP pyrophosphatase MutT (NUDIX family)